MIATMAAGDGGGRTGPGGRWMAARQPLLLAAIIGCVVSLAASGRVSVRLVADGAVSFAFVPLVETAAFAVVYRRGGRALPFAAALDRFFLTNAPWLVVMTALAALCVADTPQQIGPWIQPPRVWIAVAVAAGGLAWSAVLDVAFFRAVLGRTRASALADALVFRAIAWPLALVYFIGFAIPPVLVGWVRGS
jgi:hypothetical protein